MSQPSTAVQVILTQLRRRASSDPDHLYSKLGEQVAETLVAQQTVKAAQKVVEQKDEKVAKQVALTEQKIAALATQEPKKIKRNKYRFKTEEELKVDQEQTLLQAALAAAKQKLEDVVTRYNEAKARKDAQKMQESKDEWMVLMTSDFQDDDKEVKKEAKYSRDQLKNAQDTFEERKISLEASLTESSLSWKAEDLLEAVETDLKELAKEEALAREEEKKAREATESLAEKQARVKKESDEKHETEQANLTEDEKDEKLIYDRPMTMLLSDIQARENGGTFLDGRPGQETRRVVQQLALPLNQAQFASRNYYFMYSESKECCFMLQRSKKQPGTWFYRYQYEKATLGLQDVAAVFRQIKATPGSAPTGQVDVNRLTTY